MLDFGGDNSPWQMTEWSTATDSPSQQSFPIDTWGYSPQQNQHQKTEVSSLSQLLDSISRPSDLQSLAHLTGHPLQHNHNNTHSQPATFEHMHNAQRFGALSARRASAQFASPANSPIGSMSQPATPLSASSQSQHAPKNPKLYKTELCRSWMDSGRCNYGERCQYAHGEQEKRPIPRHPKYKTEACQSFHQSGYCPYGPRCHFIHSETELLAQLSATQHLQSALRVPSLQQQSQQQQQQQQSLLPPLTSSASLGGLSHSLLPHMTTNNKTFNTQLRGYGSAGESASSSSADSGSESPNGSFSPGLELDESHLSGFFSPPTAGNTRGIQLPSAFSSFGAEGMCGLIGDMSAWTFDDKTFEESTRLPVFAQLGQQ